ncbi:MAG: sigma 54-interacting transcriptional regulator [Gemmataceae bacterium]|nr:sigma 54-interacting transcriptional regulator [Gemmataceae bacterium]
MPTSREPARWQPLFRESPDPLAILDDRRRVRFVNAAFETWSGLRFAELRGRICRRRLQPADAAEQILAALAPSEESLAGRIAEVRRRVLLPSGSVWADLSFVPLAGSAVSGMLIRIAPSVEKGSLPSLPDRLIQIAHAHRTRFRLDELDAIGGAGKRLASQIRLAASARFPVLFHGPPGAGKEHWARVLHACAAEANRPFLTLDATLLPAETFKSHLLEHASDGFGAVLVKHPEKLTQDIQAQWAEIATRHEGPRWLAASSEPPSRSQREWHPDLAAIFETFAIAVPPLSAWKSDLPMRIESLLPTACTAAGKPPLGLSEAAMETLVRHDWPGNVAELIDALREAAHQARGERIEASDLPFRLRAEIIPEETPIRLDEVLEQTERRLIADALRKSRNNKAKAAESLGIWRARLLRRMEQLGIGGDASPGAEEPPCEIPN